MTNRRALKNVIGCTLVTLIMVSCGGPTVALTATPTVPPSPTPLSPEDVLELAVNSMKGLESYHFEMVIQMTISSEGSTNEVPLTFIGDFMAPDRLRGELTMEIGEFSIETEIISIGEVSYIKNPTSGEWQMSTESATPFTPEDFVGLEPDDIANMEGLKLLGESVLGGVSVYHIQGMLSTEVIEAILGEGEGEIMIDYWIGVEDGWVRQADVGMTLIEKSGDPQELRATGVFKFSEFNKEIFIEAP